MNLVARFTDQQIEDANRIDLVAYLRARGEKVVPEGSQHRWIYRDATGEHDSVAVRGNRWYDHRQQKGGAAVLFVQEYIGLSFREAVVHLLGPSADAPTLRRVPLEESVPERKPFELPSKAPNMRRLYAYLCKTRGIAPEVVTHFVRAGVLYEGAEWHNAVFLATDDHGAPKGGLLKSTATHSRFRQTIEGSDTRYGFHHHGTSGRVYVFEAAVDMLSFITLRSDSWQQHSYLTLDGGAYKPLEHLLATHSDVREVCLCLDADKAGLEAAARMEAKLREAGYEAVSVELPPQGCKDWNDVLLGQRQAPPECDMKLEY